MKGTIFERPGISSENVLHYLERRDKEPDFGPTQQWHLDKWVEILSWKINFYARASSNL